MADQTMLFLERFCGKEVYPVTEATWNLYFDEYVDRMTLCFSVKAGPGSVLHEDTESLRAEPSWEVSYLSEEFDESLLVAGAKFLVPEGYDEDQGGHITNFYYIEHEDTEENAIEIMAVDGGRMLVRMTGETVDVNFLDGSKPMTRLVVEAWFNRDEGTMRSVE